MFRSNAIPVAVFLGALTAAPAVRIRRHPSAHLR